MRSVDIPNEQTPNDVEDPQTTERIVWQEEERLVEADDKTFFNAADFKAYCMGSYDCLEMVGSIIFLIICCLVEVFCPILNRRPMPYQLLEKSGDYIRNLSYNEDFTGKESVTDVTLILVAVVLPLFIQLILGKLFGRPNHFHATICSYSTAIGLTILSTAILKVYVGYLRPFFYNICEPDNEYLECTNSRVSTDKLDDLRKSFPSGHASISFCSLLLFSLYLEHNFGLPSIQRMAISPISLPSHGSNGNVINRNSNMNNDSYDMGHRIIMTYTTKNPVRYRLTSIFCLLPLIVAFYFATSRIVDNEHHPADVVGGSVLGSAVAVFFHRLWFPFYPENC